MDCVNHPGVNAAAYCQNCGKAMCAECARKDTGGHILCEPCRAAWQSVRAPFAEPPVGSPNPVVAALLGFLPGVGAMYNGQFLKGFIHVGIFAALVSVTSTIHSDLDIFFGILIPAWILYQVFEAYHTAKARRDGEPLPDPLGLNELAGWFHSGVQAEFRRGHNAAANHPPAPGQTTAAGSAPGAGAAQAPPATGFAPAGTYAPPYSAPYGNPYQGAPPPFAGTPPAGGYAAGFVPPGPGYPGGYPPVPPVPPVHWRRREPVAAIILIALGVLFLLGQWDWFSARLFEYAWPVLLIGLGLWLIIRRTRDVPLAGPVPGPMPSGAQSAASGTPDNGEHAKDHSQDIDRESHGGSL